MRQRTVLQIGVDLLDDRMLPVGLVRGHGTQQVWVGGGEYRVEAVQIKQARLMGVSPE